MKNVSINLSNVKIKVDNFDIDKKVAFRVDLNKLSDVVKDDAVQNIEDKMPDLTSLTANTTLNAKINEVGNKIPNITNLATTIAVTAVENKVPNVSNLLKKKLITTQKIVKSKIKLLLIFLNILLRKNLIILVQD